MTIPTHPAGRWYAMLRGQIGDQHGWPMIAAAQAVADAAIAHLNAHRSAGTDPVTSSDPVRSVIASQTFEHLVAHEQAAHPTLVFNQPLPCRLDRDELYTWLSRPDRGGTSMAQRLRIDDTFAADNPHLADRLWRLLVEAQFAGVFGVPEHGIEIWQLTDSAPISGYLISVQPPHGPELVDGTHSAQTLLGRDAAGVRAAVNALTTIAQRTNSVLAEQTRLLHARHAATSAPSCTADPDRIRDWLASPSTEPGLADEPLADVWDFGTTFTHNPGHNAANLVDHAQQAGVFGVPVHQIVLWYAPATTGPIRTASPSPSTPQPGSGWARTGSASTTSSPPTSRDGPPPSTASPPSRPRSTRSSPRPQPPPAPANRPRLGRARPAPSHSPAPAAATKPPPPPASGPVAAAPAPSARRR